MAIPGLPGGSIIYQGHLFALKRTAMTGLGWVSFDPTLRRGDGRGLRQGCAPLGISRLRIFRKPPIDLGVPCPFFSGIPLFRKPSKTQERNSWFLKRTMVENNGESTPRIESHRSRHMGHDSAGRTRKKHTEGRARNFGLMAPQSRAEKWLRSVHLLTQVVTLN